MMNPVRMNLWTVFATALLCVLGCRVDIACGQAASRAFEFKYQFELPESKEGKTRVWVPIASETPDQKVVIVSTQFPGEPQRTTDEKFGNQIYYFELDGSAAKFEIVYRIDRTEVKSLGTDEPQTVSTSEAELKKFLPANKLVPTNGRPIELFAEYQETKGWTPKPSTTGKGEQFYQFVYDYMAYDKSKPGYGRGDVIWACDSKTGNCTDFHSMFISLARSRKIPAKFEIGFPLPKERGAGKLGGYHCWAKFYDTAMGWVPVDISEADKTPEMYNYYFGNLSENRVHFSTGRDVNLHPKQQSPPLNYFIYPHVEVDGKSLERKNIKMKSEYRDLEISNETK